jgi:hypothetical protein
MELGRPSPMTRGRSWPTEPASTTDVFGYALDADRPSRVGLTQRLVGEHFG